MGVAAEDPGVRSVARTGLPVAGGILAGGLALSAVFAATGFGLTCPFLAVTGWLCPLCGGTRMGGALLHGDVAAALAYNPVALIAVVVLGVLALIWAVELLGGPPIRPPERVRGAWSWVPPWAWPALGGAGAVAYAVVRNLP